MTNGKSLLMMISWLLLAGPSGAGEMYKAIAKDDILAVNSILNAAEEGSTNSFLGGVTPLHMAAAMNKKAVTVLLVCRDVPVDIKTGAGFTPLHWAVAKDAVETTEFLIASGADVNATTRHGITPLHWAAAKNATNVIRQLVKAGAKIDARTPSGRTPLHYAVAESAREAAIFLAFNIVDRGMAGDGTNDVDLASWLSSTNASLVQTQAAVIPSCPPLLKGGNVAIRLGKEEELEFVWVEDLQIWAGKYEVSNGQYRRFSPLHNSLFRESVGLNSNDYPVVFVNWYDANSYCTWLNAQLGQSLPEGWKVRLPTGKEWESLARCGTQRKYPWGESLPPTQGNYCDDTARIQFKSAFGVTNYNDGYAAACPVSKSGVNEWRLYGMAGNVWEWCEDWYDLLHTQRVRKGAGWDFDGASLLPVEVQGFDRPKTRVDTIGFRLVIVRE